MPSRSVNDRHALCTETVQGATNVVNFRYHEVDVMEHRTPTPIHPIP